MYPLLATLIITLLLLSCEKDKEPIDDDANGDDDTGGGAWPDDLPACDPFQEMKGWFEIDQFEEKAGEYYSVFGINPATCTALIEGLTLTVQCDGWGFSAKWIEADHFFPIDNLQAILVYAVSGSTGDLIWVMDEMSNTLIYQSNAIWSASMQINDHQLMLEGEKSCEYYNKETWPTKPASWDAPWERVFGYSISGFVDNSTFEIEQPGQTTLTNDLLYYVIFPYAFLASVDLGDCADCDYPHRFLIQIVKS